MPLAILPRTLSLMWAEKLDAYISFFCSIPRIRAFAKTSRRESSPSPSSMAFTATLAPLNSSVSSEDEKEKMAVVFSGEVVRPETYGPIEKEERVVTWFTGGFSPEIKLAWNR